VEKVQQPVGGKKNDLSKIGYWPCAFLCIFHICKIKSS